MKKTFTIFAFAFILSLNIQAIAQWVQVPNGMGNTQTVYSFAVSGNNIFAGTFYYGVYLSTDNGTNWTHTSLNNNISVYSLAVSGNNIYAGTDHGVYLSTNNGTSWTQIALSNSSITALATIGNNIFAGKNNYPVGSCGIYLSTNNGASWDQTNLYNKTVRSLMPLGNIILAGVDYDGVYLSTNNGTTWIQTALNNQSVYSLAVSGNNIFAGTDYSVCLSTNNGTSWTQIASFINWVPALTTLGNNVFAGTENIPDGSGGVYLSTNDGTSWTQTALNNQSVRSLAISGNDIFAGTVISSVWRGPLSEIMSNYLYIISPNGGENYTTGTSQNITWNSSGIQNVKIELTTDNGSSWLTISQSYPAVSGSYTWTLPNYLLTNCKIRISDILNPGTNDISDNPFTILPINYIFPTSGAVNNIVIFIRFASGGQFSEPISFYEQLYNDPTVNLNSLYNYYKEVSYNKLYIQSLFYPIQVGNNVVAYQDNNERGYYKPFNIFTNPSGYVNQEERHEREELLCVSAINAVKDGISPALEIDANDDGFVDGITFIAEGDREEPGIFGHNSDYIFWPHAAYFNLYHPSIYEKQVIRYNFHIQNNLKDSEYGVGVLAHELFHLMGVYPHAPDLYRSSNYPVCKWDLMDLTTNPPVHMGAYMKHEWGGWIDTSIVIEKSGYYSLASLSNGANNYYTIQSNDASGNEIYYLEYRKKNTIFENSLPSEGLLVYRINNSINGNNNEPSDPYNVYIYRKDGTLSEMGDTSHMAYSSDYGRTAINNTTNPRPFLSDGTDGGLKIDNIGSIGDSITFRVIISKPPTVQFSASNQNIHPGQSVSFYDSSTNYPTSWSWSFPGGSPASSNEQNPTNIVYNNIGSYEVSLTASNEFGTTQLSKYTYINVTPMTPTYNSVLKNGVLTSANTYEFDIYLMRTGTDIFELSGFQVAISFNPAIKNGGNISFAKIDGTYGFTYFTPGTPSVDNTNNILKVTTKDPPGHGNGDIVSVSPGLRYGRFRITTSASSFGASTADLAWYFNAGIYPTVVTAYDQTTSAIIDITVPASNTSDLNNIVLPVEFASFTANINIRDVSLNWRTIKETNNKGFEIERRKTDEEWSKVGYIEGNGTTNTETSYKFDDKKLNTGKYNYRLKQIDYNGNFEYHTLNMLIEVGLPTKFDLSQNYPNPFNPKTKIDFELPLDCRVTLKIYDITGREIAALLNNEFKTADYYTIDFDASNFASGIYFYRLQTEKFMNVKRMVLIK